MKYGDFMKCNVDLIAKLCNAYGVPGRENEVALIIEKEFKRYGYTVERDWIGNVIAYKGKTPPKNPIMIGAHMDEIGLMVKQIDKSGFVHFAKIGGIDDRTLINQRVIISTKSGPIAGVIGNKPPHLMKDEERKRTIEKENLFIDVGAENAKEMKKRGIEIGDPISFDIEFKLLSEKTFTGKALDNRIGCYALLELAKECKNPGVVFVGTSQEEVSSMGKGAMLAAYKITPVKFIAVDTTIAGDHPGIKEDESNISLFEGPTIVLIEAGGRGNVSDMKLINEFTSAAKRLKMKYQLEVFESGATDAASVYRVKEGIPSIAICVPTRYIHSNVSLASFKDIEDTIRLVGEYIKKK